MLVFGNEAEMEVPDKVRKTLDELPDTPGCYVMRNRRGRIIYVGKAKSLRKRVQSYFRRAALVRGDPKLRGLVHSVADLEFITAKTEAEAALTEGRLIKEYRPRYNVKFRDDKRFLMLAINLDQPFPRLELARIQRDDGRSYFGPYVSSAAAREAVRFLEKRFGLRRCMPRLPAEADHEHCIDDIVRYCSAPCTGRIAPEAYAERVAIACAFLRGESPEYLREIRAEMEKASETMNFERAAALRDALFRLEEIAGARGRMASTPQMKAEECRVAMRQLAEALQLAKPPRLIEAYDISNISGTFAVGGMVCAVDGMPQRNRYRRFSIKTVSGADDPAMMAEVVSRSFSPRNRGDGRMPDLVLVDGGIAQLRAARRALAKLGLQQVPVAGLAKKFEELYWREDGTTIRLAASSAALKMLQRIRDEAHRFALDYHHRLRARRIKESVLDSIPGIGPARKEALLRHFGSIHRLRKASESDIAAVSGVGNAIAVAILQALHNRST
jgi:excinuclease ABC subunit C